MELCRQPAARNRTDSRKSTKKLTHGLCAGRRSAGPYVLDDLPCAVWLALINDYVAAFGIYFDAGGDVGQRLLKVAAVARQIAGSLEILAMQRQVAVESGHDRLEQRTRRRRAGDAFAVELQERRVCSIKLQDRFELFRAQVLHPGFTKLGECFQSCGLRRGRSVRCAEKRRDEDQSDSQESDDGAQPVGNSR